MKLINHCEEEVSNVTCLISEKFSIDKELNNTVNELRNIEEKIYKIFDLNPCPMSITDYDTGEMIDVNESFIKVTGFDKNDINKGKLNIVREKDKKHVIKTIKENGEIKNYLCFFKTKKGKIKRGLFSGSLIKMKDKDCILLICQVINKKCIFNMFKTSFFF